MLHFEIPMIKRLAIYLKEMFPLSYFFIGPLMGSALWISMARIQKNPIDALAFGPMIMAAITISLGSLLLRIMDELKDYEDDKHNFPQRALPRGAVKISDLKVLMLAVALGMLVLNLYHPWAAAGVLILLFQSWLMFKWFFCEQKIRGSLSLALATHHPIVLTYYLYLAMIFGLFHSMSMKAFFIIPASALLFTHWEISRKMRSNSGEDNYTTYTKLWGTNNCLWITRLIRLFCFISIIFLIRPHWVLAVVYLILGLVLEVRYLQKMKSRQAVKTLKNEAEIWTIGSLLMMLVSSWK